MKNVLLAIIVSVCIPCISACNRNDATGVTTRPDNTGINKVDRDPNTVTPPDQKENAADVKITADIRRAVMDDNSLSTNAHNVKIVTSNGMVTLRGVVDSAGEKDSVGTKAKSVPGVSSVDNQLEIKTP